MAPCNRFDMHKEYTPLFFLAEPPDEYLAALEHCNEHCDECDFALLPISSTTPSLAPLLSEISHHANDSLSAPMPFLNATIPEVYSFVKSHLLKPLDSTRFHHFTDFTFAFVDSECFRKSPAEYTILICSDAPDFKESKSEIRLKTVRRPLREAASFLQRLETLTITPMEAKICPRPGSYSDIVLLRTLPLSIMMPIEPYTNDEDQEYILATPAEARVRKREAIMAAEAAGWRIGRGHPGGEPIPTPSELKSVRR